ncbi:hypothetical protein AURDEDRAFT_164333 [Auricularia subglabra TFB-10046 SS5]|nr:hypothetical protein AURDEDRAFT_164333 [Auricularia subglabra TFB-10046 SS5]
MVAPLDAEQYVNVTIDDSNGDARTGMMPAYDGDWLVNPNAEQFGLDSSRLHDGTFHSPGSGKEWRITINFNRSAIYVFFAIYPGMEATLKFYWDSFDNPATYDPWIAPVPAEFSYSLMVFGSRTLPEVLLALVAFLLWRHRLQAEAGVSALAPFPAETHADESSGKENKRRYRDTIISKEPPALPVGEPSSIAAAGTPASPEDNAVLRAELERMRVENLMLRQVADPPPYAG